MVSLEDGLDYPLFFEKITGYKPYPYQIKYAEAEDQYTIVNVFAGAGKTETVVLGWIWKRFFLKKEVPRKLIYCLPMRTLVEQTYERINKYLKIITSSYENCASIKSFKILGGDFDESWDIYPENEEILVGTQDMLISRALNRGYGTTRFRWPMDFGLLNNDSLWIFDEIQLMGDTLKTSTQLQGFRETIGTLVPTQSVWMSATVSTKSLESVDYKPPHKTLSINDDDLKNINLNKIYYAKKNVNKSPVSIEDTAELAKFIIEKHKDKTIIIVNTVSKAVQLYQTIKKLIINNNEIELLLIHSHFRMPDRNKIIEKLANQEKNRIIVSTQVIEAGIDISSSIMFSEIAPISSIIQRAGRCNRRGEYDNAEIYLIYPKDLDKYKPEPYENLDILDSINQLNKVISEDENSEFNLNSLNSLHENKYNFVLRRNDLFQLFNTEPGLTGNDIDISRFVRSGKDINSFVFWRDKIDTSKEPLPSKEELCPVPVSDINEIRNKEAVYKYDWLTGKWNKLNGSNTGNIIPGNIYMLDSNFGHYLPEEGWNIKSKSYVEPVRSQNTSADRSYEGNSSSITTEWKSIEEHTNEVCQKVTAILNKLNIPNNFKSEIIEAAKWHDAGKAHPIFQGKIKQDSAPTVFKNSLAKAPPNMWRNSTDRKYFRHELASGMLALEYGKSDLVAYLALSHHGKVRTSIRSLPEETKPPDPVKKRFARGVWDGDVIPAFTLSKVLSVPKTQVNLSYMELGNTGKGESWDYRVSKLCEDKNIGIFRLGYMENIVRSGDQRASGGLP